MGHGIVYTSITISFYKKTAPGHRNAMQNGFGEEY